jgi:hypothetical protein
VPVTAALAEDEDRWVAMADSARSCRKARGREKCALALAAKRHTSNHLAMKEPAEHVNVVAKASKLRELKDTLKGCSAVLQAHVSRKKILDALSKPLGVKPVSDLGKAALGSVFADDDV